MTQTEIYKESPLTYQPDSVHYVACDVFKRWAQCHAVIELPKNHGSIVRTSPVFQVVPTNGYQTIWYFFKSHVKIYPWEHHCLTFHLKWEEVIGKIVFQEYNGELSESQKLLRETILPAFQTFCTENYEALRFYCWAHSHMNLAGLFHWTEFRKFNLLGTDLNHSAPWMDWLKTCAMRGLEGPRVMQVFVANSEVYNRLTEAYCRWLEEQLRNVSPIETFFRCAERQQWGQQSVAAWYYEAIGFYDLEQIKKAYPNVVRAESVYLDLYEMPNRANKDFLQYVRERWHNYLKLLKYDENRLHKQEIPDGGGHAEGGFAILSGADRVRVAVRNLHNQKGYSILRGNYSRPRANLSAGSQKIM